MTGDRRRGEYVVARPIIKAIALGVVLSALGHLLVLGAAITWLRHAEAAPAAVWTFVVAAGIQMAAGIAAVIGYGWSR
jgi:hypothetical protein